jgi:protein-S-isoprenylcysteine O-methyltransferase Ste14
MTETRDAPGVVAPPPLIYLLAFAAGYGLEALLPSAAVPDWLRSTLGPLLIGSGSVLLGSFVAQFRRAGTAVDPRRPTTAIVTRGPYRITRNPAYLGMALLYSGIAVSSGALWPFATLVPALVVMDRLVIAREERYLDAKFGDQYRRYRSRVRRWA